MYSCIQRFTVCIKLSVFGLPGVALFLTFLFVLTGQPLVDCSAFSSIETMNSSDLSPYTLTEFQQLVTAALDVTPESDQLPASLKMRQSRRKSSLFRVPSFHSGSRAESKGNVDGKGPEGTGLRKMVRGTLRRMASMFIRESPSSQDCSSTAAPLPQTPIRPRPRLNSLRPLAFPPSSVASPTRAPSCSTMASSPDSMVSCITSASSHPPSTPTHSVSPLRLPIPLFHSKHTEQGAGRVVDEFSIMDDDSLFSQYQLDLGDPFVKADVEIVRSKRKGVRMSRPRSQIIVRHSQIVEEPRLPPTPRHTLHPQEQPDSRHHFSQPSSSSPFRTNALSRPSDPTARTLDVRQSSPVMTTKEMSIQDLSTLFPTPPRRPLSEQLRRDQSPSLPNFSRGYTPVLRPTSTWSDTSSEDDAMEIESIIAAHGDIRFEERVEVDLDAYGVEVDPFKRSSVLLPEHKHTNGRRQRRSYYHHGRNDSGVRMSVALPELASALPPKSTTTMSTPKAIDGPRADSPFPFL
ncbi:hypothetical protein BDV98DRAFT_608397 [Pterulicium gracile]|uniref:Uncharacterized protein n=1 Tax=Pterulicium gracile TaxID=1884261 RepID=A0A5C3Q2G8_9AGAR|nr:hypothetical protein BDV98DRAFT_608397 [Pterula gracilis]